MHLMIESVKAWAAHPQTAKKPSTTELVARLRGAAQELLNRAHAKQPDAVRELCLFTHSLVCQLTYLGQTDREEVIKVASTFEEWPILYAPDNKDAHAPYEYLQVGTDSFIPRYAGRKIDYQHNLWTQYAVEVLRLLRLCKKPWPLREPCRKFSIPTVISVGRTDSRIYWYDTPDGLFQIPEWCECCRDLPDKLVREEKVIEKFWKPARLAILEYWFANPSAYKNALKRFKKRRVSESLQRGDALDSIKRAMWSLAQK